MKITSHNIDAQGSLADPFGSRGTQFTKTMPSRSFHLAWSDVPKDTVSLALIFIDYDSIPVCGFAWIHWIVANIDPNLGQLPENASHTMELLEGVNSCGSPIAPTNCQLNHTEATAYGGCAPPDKAHRYTVNLYALNAKLDLQPGFYMNELLKGIEKTMLAKATLHATYEPKD